MNKGMKRLLLRALAAAAGLMAAEVLSGAGVAVTVCVVLSCCSRPLHE